MTKVEVEKILGPVLPAMECAKVLEEITEFGGVAVYLLVDLLNVRPVYCGTAKSKTRISSHLHKDDLRSGPVGKTKVNMPLREYCLQQPQGWLGVAFKIYPSEKAAKAKEREIIADLGIVKAGGLLFNQRFSG